MRTSHAIRITALFLLGAAASASADPPVAKEMAVQDKDVADFLTFSEDSRFVAAIMSRLVVPGKRVQREIALFDVEKAGEFRRLISAPTSFPQYLRFSPDGSLLAAFGHATSFVLWDVRKGKELRELEASRNGYETVFSSDGAKLIARLGREPYRQHDNYLISVWDVASGKKERDIEAGSRGEIRAFAVSADAEHLLTEHHLLVGRDDKGRVMVPFQVTVHVWSLKSGKHLGTTGPKPKYRGGFEDFTSSGATLVAAGAAGPGYCRRDMNGREHFWTPWRGRLGFAQNGQPVVFPDYRPLKPVLHRGVGNVGLVDPIDERPLTGPMAFREDVSPFHSAALSPDGAKLATATLAMQRTPIKLWNVADLAAKVRARAEADENVETLWRTLTVGDPKAAHPAMRSLAARPALSLPLLAEKLRAIPAPKLDEKALASWLGELGASEFAKRDAAAREIERIGAAARGYLEMALAAKPPLEAARRIEKLLEKLADLAEDIPHEELRALRGIDVLEQIGDAEAGKLLAVLADGPKNASVTHAAREALSRLAADKKRKPAKES